MGGAGGSKDVGGGLGKGPDSDMGGGPSPPGGPGGFDPVAAAAAAAAAAGPYGLLPGYNVPFPPMGPYGFPPGPYMPPPPPHTQAGYRYPPTFNGNGGVPTAAARSRRARRSAATAAAPFR
eukprot:TRINITY_DN1766_c0_g1_i5.p4 TRINITY_DN1766_c0_g1~~TRINITY_DN1766_c0_g1_i5.p4  ORF type:complete len:121 (-),score=10.58 TRINITY_DN1766_c0_g1_i5:85-447(-)